MSTKKLGSCHHQLTSHQLILFNLLNSWFCVNSLTRTKTAVKQRLQYRIVPKPTAFCVPKYLIYQRYRSTRLCLDSMLQNQVNNYVNLEPLCVPNISFNLRTLYILSVSLNEHNSLTSIRCFLFITKKLNGCKTLTDCLVGAEFTWTLHVSCTIYFIRF